MQMYRVVPLMKRGNTYTKAVQPTRPHVKPFRIQFLHFLVF